MAHAIAGALLGDSLHETNLVRRGLVAYQNIAGIDTGYGYFGPNVPDSYKLVFELYHKDGRVVYTLPEVGSAPVGKRLSNLFDFIANVPSDDVRQMLIKMVAYSTWQHHPEVVQMRAVFGRVRVPTVTEFLRGERESYNSLYVYDLDFPGELALPNE